MGNQEIRFITEYGLQECWDKAKKLPFFVALNREIVIAKMAGKSLFISMDANSKLGSEYIPGNQHIIIRPGVAGVVLQSPPSFIHSLTE